MIPTVLGSILCVTGICVAGELADYERSSIAADAIVLIAERHQVSTEFVLKVNGAPVDSRFQQVPIQVRSASQTMTLQQVRPPVKEFIKRVVVPILVERYIARLNRDRLLAGTREPS